SPLPGKQRCGRHGGMCTGARTPEGSRRVTERMHEGRRRWIDRMREEGRQLPFAGFNPKGSGLTREVREAEAQAQRSERFEYGEAKREAEAAMASARLIRATLPRYVRQDHFETPGDIGLAHQAVLAFQELQEMRTEGPFASLIEVAKTKAFMPVMRVACIAH